MGGAILSIPENTQPGKQIRHIVKKWTQRENQITYSNELIGVVHHGYEHVQQHDERDDVVGTKHSGPNKLCELMSGFHIGDIEIQQTKHRPEERLEGLEKSGKTNKQIFTWLLGSGKWKSMPIGALDLLKLGVTWCESSVGGTGSAPSLGAPASGGECTNIRSWNAKEHQYSTELSTALYSVCTPTGTHWPMHIRVVSHQ